MSASVLDVRLGRLQLSNPVMNASGTAGYGEGLSDYGDLSLLGAFVTKGISLTPRPGNPPPRIVETPSGMLNSIGLANIGAEAFISEKLPYLRKAKARTIVNIYGSTVEDYETLASRFENQQGIAALEVNISCPNVRAGGMLFGQDPESASIITSRVRSAAPEMPILVKLTPEAPDLYAVAESVLGAGADAICLVNTFKGLAIDLKARRPVLAETYGGLSGPAIRPLALRYVHEMHRHGFGPIVGVGGISSWEHAAEFVLAGASAVQIGTGILSNPRCPWDIRDGLSRWASDLGQDIAAVVGSLS